MVNMFGYSGKLSEILAEIRQVRVQQLYEQSKPEATKSDEEKDVYWKLEKIEEKIDDISVECQTLQEKLDSLEFNDLISNATLLAKKLQNRAEDNANLYNKLELLVNEFKGCVSMSRAALKASQCEVKKPKKKPGRKPKSETPISGTSL